MSEDKKGKPKYQKPVVMPLGDIASGGGQKSFHSGGTASNCSIGSIASNNCNNGVSAGNRCVYGQIGRG